MSDGVQTQNQLVTVNKSNEAETGTTEQELLALMRAGGAGAAAGGTVEDFMGDEECLYWVRENVANLLQQVRSQYVPIHDEWLRINNMLTMTMETDAKYKGETQVYLPLFAKAIETRTAHVCKASFPSDTFFDAVALKMETEAEVNARQGAKAWMKRQLTGAKLRSNMKPFVRSVLAYGVGFLKGWWEDSLVQQKNSRRKFASPDVAAMLESAASGPKKYCGKFRVKAANNFAIYAWPLTVDHIDQCTIVFEDIQVSKQFVNAMIAQGYWKEENIIQSNTDDGVSETARQNNLSQNTKTANAPVTAGIGGDLGNYTQISECWFDMPLPKRYFTADEIASGEHNNPQPMKATICGQSIVNLERNPFNHGKHPFVMKKLVSMSDVLITPGYGKLVMTSQYLANDLVNQVNDNGIYGLNPLVIRDLTKIAEHSLAQKIYPGAVFDVNDKGALEFDRPPVEQISYGTQLIHMATSQVNDVIAPPILQGTGGGGGAANTATGAQLLQGNTKIDIQDFNEDMEEEVFQRIMVMAQSLGQQFESEEMYLAVTGQEKIKFTPKMLGIEVSWQWVASSQTINQQLRGQQMQQFLGVLMNEFIIQMLAQKGIQLDVIPILQKIWEDGLGQRSFESLLIRQQPIPGSRPMPTLPPTQPGMPGAQPQLSPDQLSAVSQNPTALNQATPTSPVMGEGEEFRNVKTGAEDMAGALGILGNMPRG